MKPIVKVKNPVLRYLAGAVMFVLGVGAVIVILYGGGLATMAMGFPGYDVEIFWGIVGLGFVLLLFIAAGLFLALAAIVGVYEGVRYLGNKFFYP